MRLSFFVYSNILLLLLVESQYKSGKEHMKSNDDPEELENDSKYIKV